MSLVIELPQGKLKGKQNTSVLNDEIFYTFSGIPYAKPPTGDLRFRAPEPAGQWHGVYDATFERGVCIQRDEFETNSTFGTEDCLYLNINIPEKPSGGRANKAVMVFIHGGAFVMGSGSETKYPPDCFVSQDVVLVTLNYRLYAFGFLNLGIPECPGNAGLRDQALALKWVKDNIQYFGGNPNNITIFGESAGASSVHYHMLSRLSRGLFNKAILQSGSALCPWALTYNPEEAAEELAQKFGFTGGSTLELLNFLKKQNARDIAEVAWKMTRDREKKSPGKCFDFLFVPSVEKIQEDAFLPDLPENLLHTVDPIPIIFGSNDKEGVLIGIHIAHTVESLNKDFSCVLRNNFKIDSTLVPDLSDKIKRYYFGDKPIVFGENLINLHTDLYFYRFYESIGKFIDSSTPPYVYEYVYDGELNMVKHFLASHITLNGAGHGDELRYMFYPKSQPDVPPLDGEILIVAQNLASLWSNFAKTGNPSSIWKPCTPDEPRYLKIDRRLTLVNGKVYGERMQFLKGLLDPVIESYYSF